MKLHLIFIGNKFIYNRTLKEYILRSVMSENEFIDTITSFGSSDNSLFLYIEEQLNSNDKLIIVTSRNNFSTIGKLISTATSDNQVLKDGMLMPQKASLYEERSYLLEYKEAAVNVIQIDENQKMPQILLQTKETLATIHVFDEPKESLIVILQPIAQTYEVQFEVTTLVNGWLQIDVISKRYGDISNFINGAKNLFPNKLLASSNVVAYIIERLSQMKKKVSFAESCTGGLLSYYFTKHNGASNILDGSLVTYSNSLKENWLAVSHETLESNGAVSAEVVEEMSEGAMSVSSADYTLSISGIAGDSGGTKEKPVGTVYISARTHEVHHEERLQFQGDRNYVQEQSALYAIKMLLLIDKKTFF